VAARSGTPGGQLPPVGLDRARQRELLWAAGGEAGSPPGPDRSVRRSLGLDFAVARAALVDVQLTTSAVPAGRRASDPRPGATGWLAFADVPAVTTVDEIRLRGALHVGRCGGAIPVEVVLAPWSTSRSELRLQLHRRSNLPGRFFDVAHRVMDELRDEIQRRADALIDHRRGTLDTD
jgi:hypothetical protein